MPDTKITALTALTAADPANDVLPIVDVSDTTMAASGTTKKISINNVLGASGTATLASATISGDLTVDTSTLKVDSVNNRVGILTASPGVTFDVAGPIRSIVSGGTPYLYLNNGTSQHSLSNDSNALSISVFAAEQMRIAASGVFTFYDGAGGTRMTLNSTGLGVGGTPAYKLDVAGSSAGVLRLVNINNLSTDPAAVTRLSLDGQGATWHLDNERTNGIFKITRNSTACLTIDNSGNVGIGVTPSAWVSYKSLELPNEGYISSGNNWMAVMQNAYLSGSYKYKGNGNASYYLQQIGEHRFYTAPSGTAGNAITFTQAMTLDASGNLILQSSATPATLTTNGQLTVNATSNTNLRFSYRGSDGVTRVANITLA